MLAKSLVRQTKCALLNYNVSSYATITSRIALFCPSNAVKNKYLLSSDVKSVPRLTIAEKLVSITPLQMQPYLRLMRIDRPIGKHIQLGCFVFL